MSMTNREKIEVIQACEDRKTIECRIADSGALRLVKQTACKCVGNHSEWSQPCNNPPQFSFGLFDYRVLPEEEGATPKRIIAGGDIKAGETIYIIGDAAYAFKPKV